MNAAGRKPYLVFAIGAGVVTLALNLYGGLRAVGAGDVSAEAVIRSRVAAELWGEHSRGYHALIDSALMPPLPTLASTPFAGLDHLVGEGAGFVALLAVMGAAVVIYLMFLSRRLGVHPVAGLLLGVALTLNPWTPLAPWRGTAALGSVFFITAACAHLLSWMRRDQLLSLGLCANFLALGMLWDVRLLAFAVVLSALVVAWAIGMRGGGRRLEALLIIYWTPILYAPAVWALFNWLIFGDSGRWLRDLWIGFEAPLAWLAGGTVFISLLAVALTRLELRARAAVVLIHLVAAGAILVTASMPVSARMAAVVGETRSGATDRDEAARLARYLLETKGGRLVAVVGRPGYLIKKLVGPEARFVHRLQLDIDGILRDTRGRDVCAVLTDAQVDLWKPRLGESLWERRFLEDARFGPWRVFLCVRPIDME